MKTTVEYQVISSVDYHEFVDVVSDCLSNGWECVGGCHILIEQVEPYTEFRYSQAVIRKVKKMIFARTVAFFSRMEKQNEIPMS